MPSKNTNKTVPTTVSVQTFLENYPNQKVIPDCLKLLKIYEELLPEKAVIWGKMVGFGTYHYKSKSGREGDYFICGFAPSSAGITIYAHYDNDERAKLLAKLGKHKAGTGCLYIKNLADVDLEILSQIILECYNFFKNKPA